MNGTQINRCIHLGTDKVDGVISGFNHFLFYRSSAAVVGVEMNKLYIYCRMKTGKTNGWVDDGLANWDLRNQYPRIAEEEQVTTHAPNPCGCQRLLGCRPLHSQ